MHPYTRCLVDAGSSALRVGPQPLSQMLKTRRWVGWMLGLPAALCRVHPPRPSLSVHLILNY